MASDKTTIIIDADASGVADGVKQADKSMGKLGDSVKAQDKNLNRYGEKLGAAFGPGQGLHGRLDNLETPLRDTEGAIARSQMAFIEFGNSGATAADKVGAGFLLAGDAISAFTAGGVVGVAIAAAVAAFSIINSLMQEEARLAKEAEEAQKKHAKELENLGKAAVDAGISISALQAKEAAGLSLSKVRAVEMERIEARVRRKRLQDALDDARDFEHKQTSAQAIFSAQRKLREAAAALAAQDAIVKGMANKLHFAKLQAKEDQSFYLTELKLSEESAVTSFVKSAKASTAKAAEAISVITKDAEKKVAKVSKEAKKKVFDQEKLDREIRRSNRLFDLNEERIYKDASVEIAKEDAERKRQIRFKLFQESVKQREKELAEERKAAAERKALAFSAASAVSSALFEQAKAGELNAAKLLEATLNTTGQQLVSRGTLHLFEGIASSNPVEATTGGAMIAAGLAMGAASGAISRSGEAPASPADSSVTPTDTRESRAASGGSGGDGGTTIINFNGPAYDRSGVSKVITSGQRMAKHRRIAGA